ncbi:hypothetical protein F5051DRAFT_228858 [Lentinula edodes]|nr:hypothetical protein F5051DRAFT_228858 [Lentinula edodes]
MRTGGRTVLLGGLARQLANLVHRGQVYNLYFMLAYSVVILIPFYSGAQVIVSQPWIWLRCNVHCFLLLVGHSSDWLYRSRGRNLYLQRWF